MRRPIKLFGAIVSGLLLVTSSVAPAEPVTKPAPKKHPECEGSKVKTACNQGADVKDFVTSRQAVMPSAPMPAAPETSAANAAHAAQPAKDKAAAVQQPK